MPPSYSDPIADPNAPPRPEDPDEERAQRAKAAYERYCASLQARTRPWSVLSEAERVAWFAVVDVRDTIDPPSRVPGLAPTSYPAPLPPPPPSNCQP